MVSKMDDLIAVVDDMNENVLKSVPRARVVGAKVNVRTAHTFVFTNERSHLVLQKLPEDHKRKESAGKWGSSAATYVRVDETYESAAIRSLKEDLGITVPTVTPYGVTTMLDKGTRKFVGLFGTSYEGQFMPNYSHVADVEPFTVNEILRMRMGGEERFTDTFNILLDFYLSKRQL